MLTELTREAKTLELSSAVTFKIILDVNCFSYPGHCHYLER